MISSSSIEASNILRSVAATTVVYLLREHEQQYRSSPYKLDTYGHALYNIQRRTGSHSTSAGRGHSLTEVCNANTDKASYLSREGSWRECIISATSLQEAPPPPHSLRPDFRELWLVRSRWATCKLQCSRTVSDRELEMTSALQARTLQDYRLYLKYAVDQPRWTEGRSSHSPGTTGQELKNPLRQGAH